MELLNFLKTHPPILNLNNLSINRNFYTLTSKKVKISNLSVDKLSEDYKPNSRFINVLSKRDENIYLDIIDKRLYLKYLRNRRTVKYAAK